MSRTDKTRPYWVKVNDHGVEHHDHSSLGEKVYRSRWQRDEDGNVVKRESQVFRLAWEVMEEQKPQDEYERFWTSIWHLYDEEGRRLWENTKSDVRRKEPNNWVIARAAKAMEENDRKRLIMVGYAETPVWETYLHGTVSDHCTIDEKRAHVGWSHAGGNIQPCYMEADWRGTDRRQFACGCCMCSWGGDYSADRADKRDKMKSVVKAVNSGDEDWEDRFDNYNFTPNRKGGKNWW